MGLLGGFKGKLKGSKQKSRKSISTEVVCVKYKVHSEFDSDNNYPSTSKQNGEATAVVNQKKPRVIPDAQNIFQPVKTYDPPAPVFETVAPKTEATKSDALKGVNKGVTKENVSKKGSDTKPKVKTEGKKKKSTKTKVAEKPNSSKVEEIKKSAPKENKKGGETKALTSKSPVFKTVVPKTEIEKADTSKTQTIKEENASRAEVNGKTTQVKKEVKKSSSKQKLPEAPNVGEVSHTIVRPKKKQAPKAKAPKKEVERKLTPTTTRKAEDKKETAFTKPEQKHGIKVESPNNGFVPIPDENSNIYAEYNNAEDESFKVHVVDHANSFYSNLSDAETTEAEDNDDFKFVQIKKSHSPINYSSQAASIFFGGEEEVVVRPRNVIMNDDDVSQKSSASA